MEQDGGKEEAVEQDGGKEEAVDNKMKEKNKIPLMVFPCLPHLPRRSWFSATLCLQTHPLLGTCVPEGTASRAAAHTTRGCGKAPHPGNQAFHTNLPKMKWHILPSISSSIKL